MNQLPNLGVYGNIEPCDDGIISGLNYNSVLIDALLQASVLNIVATLPGSPSDGDRYILTTNNSINYYKDTNWISFIPDEGFLIYNRNDDLFYYFNGTAWVEFKAEYDADEINFSPVSPLVSTNVQDAIEEVNTLIASKANASHTHALSDLTQSGANTNDSIIWNGTNWVPQNIAQVNLNVVTVNGSLTSNYNILSNDDIVICINSSCSVTLPTAIGRAGKIYRIINQNPAIIGYQYQILTTSSQTVGGYASGVYFLYTRGEFLSVFSDGSNWQILNHFAETEWIDGGSVVITATTTSPTKATGPVRDKFFWKRSGANVHIDMQYKAPNSTVGATNGSGGYLYNLPSGIEFDTAIAGANTSPNVTDFDRAYGTATVSDTVARPANALVHSSTQFTLWAYSTGINSYQRVGSGFFSMATNQIFYGANLILPASGWKP